MLLQVGEFHNRGAAQVWNGAVDMAWLGVLTLRVSLAFYYAFPPWSLILSDNGRLPVAICLVAKLLQCHVPDENARLNILRIV